MIIVTAAADTLPVTRAEALAQLRILSEDDLDTGQIGLIDDLIEEAVETVERSTGLTLSPKDLEQRFEAWPCGRELVLGAAPVRDVTDVAYLDADGDEQSVDPAHWSWEPTSTGAVIRFRSTWSSPGLDSDNPCPVRVRFASGCNDPNATAGDPRLDLPRPARTA
ncbi:MAG: hypothetical protein U1C74_34255, partial [Phenylobacterium sp.]|nr:hypothetical protein [Phenylobacterium sp.]